MELISALFAAVYGLFSREFTLFGYPLSFLQVMLWSAVAGIVLNFIRRLME